MDTDGNILAALHGLADAFNAHDIEGVMSFSRRTAVSTCREVPNRMAHGFRAWSR